MTETPTYRLDVFEGPLDLLLTLIGKRKIEIWDINLSLILEQYMAYLEAAKRMDMEITGEFLSMASYLVYLKSRMLLPMLEPKEQEEDPRAELARSLEAYKEAKERAALLVELWEGAGQTFVRTPELLPQCKQQGYEKLHEPIELRRAMERVLLRTGRRLPPPVTSFGGIVGREKVPVSARLSFVLKRLADYGRVGFLSLFSKVKSRSEIVATFLAVLELAKTNRVIIESKREQDGDYIIEMTPAKEG